MCFLLTSREESYPRVVLEALFYGLPVIATPVFGITEQISTENEPNFYKPGDLPALSGLIVDLANNQKKRKLQANKSKVDYSKLSSFHKMVDRIIIFWKNLCVCHLPHQLFPLFLLLLLLLLLSVGLSINIAPHFLKN